MTAKENKQGEWVDYSPKEVEDLVATLANQGQTASQIGLALRDQYGIPNVKTATQKRINQILVERKLQPDMPQDLLHLIARSVALRKHMAQNTKDFSAKRGYQLTVSKIRRLAYYYTRTGRLPADWRYSPETAALLVK